MSPEAEFAVEEVSADEVRPMRRKHLRPDRPIEDVVYRSDADPTARHFAARTPDGRIVGVGSLHLEDRMAGQQPYGSPGMRIRGIAVEEDWRGRGVGQALMERMLAVGREAGVREAWGNARVVNLGFYESSGFQVKSGEFELTGIGVHVVMARVLEDGARKA
jgi:GNAT superfamily N-acetyltransferase